MNSENEKLREALRKIVERAEVFFDEAPSKRPYSVSVIMGIAEDALSQQAEPVCDTCHGQGEVWTGENQSFGYMSMQPPEPIMEACPECGGDAEPATAQAETNVQIAAVMLQHGTPEQQAEALQYAGLPATAQDELIVYRAVNKYGSECHFGAESLARVWAGKDGSVERVELTPVPELSVVATSPIQGEPVEPAIPVDSEAWLQEWARGKFTSTGAYMPRALGQLYGNTDWALARALHGSIVAELTRPAQAEQKPVEQQTQWISVAERLPESGERVLCYVDLGDLQYQEVSTFHGDFFGDVVALKVTHWLPLPAAPGVSGKEGE